MKTLIPNGGSTYDRTPLIKLVPSSSLVVPEVIRVMRNSILIGTATYDAQDACYYYQEQELAFGLYEYVALVANGSGLGQVSAPYLITILQDQPLTFSPYAIIGQSPGVITPSNPAFDTYKTTYMPEALQTVPTLTNVDVIMTLGGAIVDDNVPPPV